MARRKTGVAGYSGAAPGPFMQGRVGRPTTIGPMIASLLADENRWIDG
jgi:hypothetical protein